MTFALLLLCAGNGISSLRPFSGEPQPRTLESRMTLFTVRKSLPTDHLGSCILVALTRFQRTLRRARLSVRQLTHTLHLPPALSESYGGSNPFWLRDLLENLPRLQSLLVSQLPFFDHQSLLALRRASSARRPSLNHTDERPQYDLKLLLAQREPNATSVGLIEALFHLPHLVYLDLSYTSPARDPSFLCALANLWDLRVLKLRGIGMRDVEAEMLANAVGIRVRLLDLRENYLTDRAVRSLTQACFLPPEAHPAGINMDPRRIEDWPVGMAPGPNFLSFDSLRSEELDRELLKQLTHPLTGRLAFEDIPHKGLTHLYIADNNLSFEGVSCLLKSTRLHILDGGSVDIVKTVSQSKSQASYNGCQEELHVPGAEKLVPVLVTYASHNLTYLRINHVIVTEPMQMKESPLPTVSAVQMPSERTTTVEGPGLVHHSLELPLENKTIVELYSEPAIPASELEGDRVHFTSSPPVRRRPDQYCLTKSTGLVQPKRGDGAFAPEVSVDNITEHKSDNGADVVLTASSSSLSSKKPFAVVSPNNDNLSMTSVRHGTLDGPPIIAHGAAANLPSPSALRLTHINNLLQKRPLSSALAPNATESFRTDRSGPSPQSYAYLHPSQLPNLRTLVLTDVPAQVLATSPVIAALLRFISACADEAYLALLRAQTNYSLPPGHRRHEAELQYARSLFALQTIILEMSSSGPSDAPVCRAWDHRRANLNLLKSSTGDRDLEALWSAAENDFSFFGEEGETEDESAIFRDEPEKHFAAADVDEKIDEKIAYCPDSNGEHICSPHNGVSESGPLQPVMTSRASLPQSPRNLHLGRDRRPSCASPNQKLQSRLPPPSKDGAASPKNTPRTVPAPSLLVSPHPPALQATATRPGEERMHDVVAELAQFRKQKKREYEEAALLRWRRTRNGTDDDDDDVELDRRGRMCTSAEGRTCLDLLPPFVPGHWAGEIKIVRNAAAKAGTGVVVDMYGSSF